MLLGSEGILGVITEAWVRVQPRPEFRAARGVVFDSFIEGGEAVRALAQSGLGPSNCRLIDAEEARFTGTADSALLVLGFESTDSSVDALLERGLAICREHGGSPRERSSDSVADWREAPPPTRSSRPAGRSPTTTRWGGITGPGTTSSGRMSSPPRSEAPRQRSIRRGS
jgi:FAD/FMN-containing dehydrogenase